MKVLAICTGTAGAIQLVAELDPGRTRTFALGSWHVVWFYYTLNLATIICSCEAILARDAAAF